MADSVGSGAGSGVMEVAR